MKIAICSLYINKWYMEIVKYGKKTLEFYCKENKYDFIWETEDTHDGVYDKLRDIPWYKIKLLLKLLKMDYDLIVWNDADSIILGDTKIEYIVDKYMKKECDILIARESGSVLNTGTMFVKNSQFSKDMLNYIWNNENCDTRTFHEQASLTDLYNRNFMNCRAKINVLEPHLQNVFLSYWFTYYPNECFILHITRCSHDIAGFLFTMDMFCPIKIDEESDAQYVSRKNWLESPVLSRKDISHYLNGGTRRNLPARYIAYLLKNYQISNN